jgi:hypothetical protein
MQEGKVIAVCCSRKDCEMKIDPVKDEHVTCPLCVNSYAEKPAIYCTEAHRMQDWITHACPNALVASQVGETRFTPYFYEDLIGEESPLVGQSLLFMHQGSDMIQRQWLQRIGAHDEAVGWQTDKKNGLGYGENPDKYGNFLPAAFEIRVHSYDGEWKKNDEIRLSGIVPHDLIFKDKNHSNPTAKKLAGMLDKISGLPQKLLQGSKFHSHSFVFWIPETIIERTTNDRTDKFMLPLQGILRVELNIPGKQPISVSSGYDVSTSSYSSAYKKLSNVVRRAFDARMRIKFGQNEDLKHFHTLYGEFRDKKVVLTFKVLPKSDAELVDIEFLVPKSAIRIAAVPPPTSTSSSGKLSIPQDEEEPPAAPAYDDPMPSLTEFAIHDKIIETPFRINPKKSEHLVALGIALDLRMPNHEQANTIRSVARSEGIASSIETQVAVDMLVNELHDKALGK